MLHHIRRSVLDKLATAEYLRYGQLKPKDLDGNVFNYHLKGLIADDLVQKNDAGNYCLTRAGRDYVVHRYEDSASSAHSIFLIVIKREAEYLLRCRDIQPFIGYTGFIHGEPEAGVAIIQSAATRLYEKTGIQDIQLSVIGSALLTQHLDGELQSFSNAIIVYGQTHQDIKVKSDTTGHNFWAELDSVEKLLPSCMDIITMIDNQWAWFESSYELISK